MNPIARALCFGLGLGAAGLLRADPFSYQGLVARARELAARPYAAPPSTVPADLQRLDYDQYRDIRYRPARSWWHDDHLRFELQFFHPGFIFRNTVQISELDGDDAHRIPFSPDLFDYGHNHLTVPPESMGFAGFRILYPLNKPGDEVGAFQGASYFRMVCADAVYGLSARGIAVDSGEPNEEFPSFTDFWIEKPGRADRVLTLYALLDGPSLSGAYRFDIAPGPETVVEVRETLFLRRRPQVLGIAPLTSMYWHGESGAEQVHDFRPQVHDSDGLMLHTGAGEWLWRPLVNPPSERIAAFSDQNPRGFGLLQRERRFCAYEDIEAQYQRRPSAWVEPLGDWGAGSVRLVELFTPDETNDNIVAYWTPAELPPPGQPLEYSYRLHWFLDQIHPPGSWVVATRHGRSRTQEPDLERFLLDFDGPSLRPLSASAPVQPVVTVGPGAALIHSSVEHDPFDGTWRAAFALRPDGSGRPVELRCFLTMPGKGALSETWSYLWQP